MDTVERMRKDLLAARKNRDQLIVETLQAALTRITNAEAVAPGALVAANGVGITEVPRKMLTSEEVQALIDEELNELTEAHANMVAHPDHPYAKDLASKITILTQYKA